MAAEAGSSSKGFAKSFSKKMFRTKEKVMQNLGKADKTTDDTFDDHVADLTRQQSAAIKFQKDLKAYVACSKAMLVASKTLYETVSEMYESNWTGCDEVSSAVQQLAILCEDYNTKMADDVQSPLSAYIEHFPNVRAKIAKRGRKLVDFDSARHSFQALNTAKKRDEMKIAKSQDDLDEARKVYEDLNSELNAELPDLYESRINFLATTFLAMFTSESKLNEEVSKVLDPVVAGTEQLVSQSSDQVFSPKAPDSPGSAAVTPVNSGPSGDQNPVAKERSASKTEAPPVSNDVSAAAAEADNGEVAEVVANGDAAADVADVADVADPTYEPVLLGAQVEANPFSEEKAPAEAAAPVAPPKGDAAKPAAEVAPPSDSAPAAAAAPPEAASSASQPVEAKEPEVLYQVVATHAYAGADSDELAFAVGDVIDVIKYDDLENEQDEGWLMGRSVAGKKGVFPANFTKKM